MPLALTVSCKQAISGSFLFLPMHSRAIASFVLGGRVEKPKASARKKRTSREAKSYFVFRLCQCMGPIPLSDGITCVRHAIRTGTLEASRPSSQLTNEAVLAKLGITAASVSSLFVVEISRTQYQRLNAGGLASGGEWIQRMETDSD